MLLLSSTCTAIFLFLIIELSRAGRLKSFAETNIVGGTEALPHQYPFIVDVRKNYGIFSYHSCGASIVNANWIVTAAHCAQDLSIFYEIVGGEHNLNVNEGTEQKRMAVLIINHESYNPLTMNNDIALMRVSRPFNLNRNVTTVEIAPVGLNVTGEVSAIGWGTLESNGDSPDTLQHVSLTVVDDKKCNEAYDGAIQESMLCAGDENGGKDSCQGDSGGPLVKINEDGVPVLVGITSWGKGCAEKEYPGVYTEVAYFNEWINTRVAI